MVEGMRSLVGKSHFPAIGQIELVALVRRMGPRLGAGLGKANTGQWATFLFLNALRGAQSSLQLSGALRMEAQLGRTECPPRPTHRALLLWVGVPGAGHS